MLLYLLVWQICGLLLLYILIEALRRRCIIGVPLYLHRFRRRNVWSLLAAIFILPSASLMWSRISVSKLSASFILDSRESSRDSTENEFDAGKTDAWFAAVGLLRGHDSPIFFLLLLITGLQNVLATSSFEIPMPFSSWIKSPASKASLSLSFFFTPGAACKTADCLDVFSSPSRK